MSRITKEVTFVVVKGGCHRCTSHACCRDRPRCMENGKVKLISRLLWERQYGSYPPRESVLRHSCDNPWCINLDHLLIGSAADNVQDAVDRGRMAKGERAGPSLLSDDQVKGIKILLEFGVSCYFLGRKYGVTPGAIQAIANGTNWKHLVLRNKDVRLVGELKSLYDEYLSNKRSRVSYRKKTTFSRTFPSRKF